MDFDGPGQGFGWIGHLFGIALRLTFGIFFFLVFIGLVFILIRFLLVATEAARIYVTKNSPDGPAPTASALATKPAPSRTAATVAAPVTKPRKPKTP
jgi:predicted lipid-binding transport protein (Tim44 family)